MELWENWIKTPQYIVFFLCYYSFKDTNVAKAIEKRQQMLMRLMYCSIRFRPGNNQCELLWSIHYICSGRLNRLSVKNPPFYYLFEIWRSLWMEKFGFYIGAVFTIYQNNLLLFIHFIIPLFPADLAVLSSSNSRSSA